MMHEYKIRPPLGLYIASSLALVILILGMVSATASLLRTCRPVCRDAAPAGESSAPGKIALACLGQSTTTLAHKDLSVTMTRERQLGAMTSRDQGFRAMGAAASSSFRELRRALHGSAVS